MIGFLLCLLLMLLCRITLVLPVFQSSRKRYFRPRARSASCYTALRSTRKKPDWVNTKILLLHQQTGYSHRQLAALFNQMFTASTGISVGRTWVRQLLLRQAYQAMQVRTACRHRIPLNTSKLQLWAADTTFVSDQENQVHEVLGLLDHGSRLLLHLQHVARFSAWSFLGYLCLAIARYGKPVRLKTDNHPVFRSRCVRLALKLLGIRQSFSAPAQPWQNGRIERCFGTLKAALSDYPIQHLAHLTQALRDYTTWYNWVRPHQHLHGLTPGQAWHKINPFRTRPKVIRYFSAWGGRLRGFYLRH